MRGIAGAPVSFGVFELTSDGPLAEPDEILGALHDAGYDGVDLGPVGWMGEGEELRRRLRRHEMALAGGWVDLPFPDDDAFTAALPVLDAALEVFVDAVAVDPDRPPLPTLADSGSEIRRAHPGGRGQDLGLDDAGWDRFARNLGTAAARVRASGLEPTFHHHVCTYVETPDEIDALLARTDVDLTLDTGHLMLGGGDPTAGLERWRTRVNHVHLKDVRCSVLDQIVREGAGSRAVWDRRVFVPLGQGDFDLGGFMTALVASGYSGWLVVEQDVIPAPDDPPGSAAADQRANRAALRTWLS
ncbi:MAG: TIM barrel protein [Jiangellaceae bacterium]